MSQPGGLPEGGSTINNRWKYFAAKRRRHASMYGMASPFARKTTIQESLPYLDFSQIEQRIFAQMSMSTDRVHFKINLLDGATTEVRTAFTKAFGIQFPSARYGQPFVTIICRPSQFARFLIYRNELGGKNLFATLDPKLVETDIQDTIDVSTNPRKN